MSENVLHKVRECRGHFHVTVGDEEMDLALTGDPFATHEEAQHMADLLNSDHTTTPLCPECGKPMLDDDGGWFCADGHRAVYTSDTQRDEHDLVQHEDGGKSWSVCQRCDIVGPPHTTMPEEWDNDCKPFDWKRMGERMREAAKRQGEPDLAQRDKLEGLAWDDVEFFITDYYESYVEDFLATPHEKVSESEIRHDAFLYAIQIWKKDHE